MPLGWKALAEVHGGLRSAGHVQFLKDVTEIVADCLLAQSQCDGNFFVGFPSATNASTLAALAALMLASRHRLRRKETRPW